MGWGTGDKVFVEDSKIAVSLARQKIYILKQAISQITHQEKKNVLVKLCDETYERLNQIDFHLNR